MIRAHKAEAYMRANLVLEMAVFIDPVKLLLLLFFSAGAVRSSYSMLGAVPSVNRAELFIGVQGDVCHTLAIAKPSSATIVRRARELDFLEGGACVA